MKSEADTKNLEFVLANTALTAAPLVPEIRLRLADNVLPLWQRTERLGAGDPPPPYWAFAWPGGQALARYILDNSSRFRGKSILDFGAGSGLVGIAAVKAGARAVAAEIDSLAVTAIEANARANNLEISCLEEDIIGRDEGWDTVCFGDMCYERPLAQRIFGWAGALKKRGAHVLLGDPGRDYFSQTNVSRLATYSVPTSRDLEDRDVRETSVYEMQAKA
ncbi:MAG: 50S ribosomal protein L11 methyltransferase [Micropepsaceae bacterium]